MMGNLKTASFGKGAAALLLLLALVCVPLVALAATSGVEVSVTNMSLSAKTAGQGDTVTFSAKIDKPVNAEVAYVYLRATDGSQQQVSLEDEDGDGTFAGELLVDGRMIAGKWQCAAIQVYTANKQWGYLRDKRAYDQGTVSLAAFDLTISGTGGDSAAPQVNLKVSQALYNQGTQVVTVEATDASGVEYLCVYYVAPDGSDLQVKLSAQAGGDRFVGSFACSDARSGDVWRCKAIQSCDAVGNWGYLYDKRYKSSSKTDLSVLDAVICEHQWSNWEEVRSSTCQKAGARQRICGLCSRYDEQPLPLAAHKWLGVATDIQPTVDQPGVGHYICAWCDGSEAFELPALGPFSSYEYLPGVRLLRYYPDQPAEGCVQFRGQDMYWIMGAGCWALLVDEDPGELSAVDFADNKDATSVETVVRSGDLNGNGEVNIVDAQVCYDMATGVYASLDELPMGKWLAADINNDGFLDAADAFAIQALVLKG